jgi:outer membrane protein assembly factor BamA
MKLTSAAKLARCATLVSIQVVASSALLAQGLASGGSGSSGRIDGSFKVLPIPYVNYDRSIELQGGALPMAMFNPVADDTLSPSSIAGLFGMYSTSKTWFVMGFGRLHLAEDDWRVTAVGGAGNYNFQFFVDVPVSAWIPYSTEMGLGYVQVQRRMYGQLYGGVSYLYLDFTTTLEALPDTSAEETLHGLGLNLSMDRRSSVYYPRNGFESSLRYFTFPSAFGNDSSSNKLRFEHNQFVSVRSNHDVVAARLFAGIGLGDVSFNQQFVVGQGKDIRGYTQGEFRGKHMLAIHGEYRWNFHHKLGLVGFGAIATVFEAINEDDNGKLLPGAGAGFRFTVDAETKMNVGMDVAVGRDDWGIYFRIAEAF